MENAILKLYLIFLSLCFIPTSSADVFTSSNQQQQYHKKYLITSAALAISDPASVFGESVDLSSGLVVFRRNDAHLPGNSDLSFSYQTYYDTSMPDVAGWKEDIPRIEYSYITSAGNSTLADGWRVGKYCSESQLRSNNGSDIFGVQHTGSVLAIPHMGKKQLLDSTQNISSAVYSESKYITNSLWKISCYISQETSAEGFKAISPNGTSYYFEHLISSPKVHSYERDGIRGSDNINVSQHGSLRRKTIALYVKRIEDRFGNYVNYSYADGGLSKMESNDGRILTVDYINNRKVVSLKSRDSSWERKWNYFIRNNKYIVTQPDGREWSYDLFINQYKPFPPGFSGNFNTSCLIYPINKIMSVTHPNGLTGEFKFSERVDYSSNYMSVPTRIPVQCSRVLNLVEKKVSEHLSGLKNESLLWRYIYSENEGGYVINGETPPDKFKLKGSIPSNVDPFLSDSIQIINPDKSYVKHYFNREGRSASEGMIIATEHFDKLGALLKTEALTYTNGINFGKLLTYVDGWENFILSKKVIADGTDEYTIIYSDFNEYNFPGRVVESSFSNTKYIKNEYTHSTQSWVMNLLQKEYISSDDSFSTPFKEYLFNDKMLLLHEKLFGNLVKTHSYYADGNLLQTTYNDSGRYEKFDDYYRGKARKITLPCATINGCNTVNGSTPNTVVALLEVNSDGTAKSVTDFNGNKTSYSYNPIGWLTKIDYADPKWADKVIGYATVSMNDDGISGSSIAVGSLRQTISQGNYEKHIYHDGLLRPIFTRERDTANASTIRYQTMAYDHENRPTLSSFPSSHASNRIGMETEYDALGRVVTQTRTSDGSVSRREYLSGNKVAVTDGENNTTTTTYLAYGEPSFDKPTLIEAPDSDDIAIEYNLFDQVTSIRQGNVTETRLYDAYQQLCKQVRPETGITAFGYNSQRQQIWRAQGANGSTTSCDAGAVPASHKTLLAYDNLGQLRTENFPDSTPDRTYSYDANGNLMSLLAGPVSWSYLYNSQSGLEKETLSLDGRNFVLDWEYNNLGALSSLKYPSGAVIDFTPNALGQPTKAGSYATNVSYHPNGQIKQFTYGNGIVRKVALDTTGRIDAITDVKASSVKNSLDPSYDYNDNLARLIDWVDRNNDVDNLVYDGVDRLKSADGKWGSGRYNYDGLGNVLSRSLNNSTISYKYNALNRLNNLTGAYAYAYQYDARGNVTNNGRYSLAYNIGQQMTAAKGINYVYDGHNRRVKQTKTDGSHYTVYSQGGQLLHRQAADGTKTDSVYLGKQLVAEVDNSLAGNPPIAGSTPPIVVLKVEATLVGGTCPPKMVCNEAVSSPAHLVTWSSTNATSCTGVVSKSLNGISQGSNLISGVVGSKTYVANGTFYQITLTCTGDGGQTTRQETASGVGGGSDM
ncbi:RHS repeat domain-containing protein [Shewanella baltica]|uniref:RHS repeat domain-containing protein n=1 Tax=Shewanella baltica TaxID=62322 RepID=UPI00217CF99B|nr:sugar-binding protein [Shewanella baltica]MCS6177672.1 RHS repeat protein [Shewanella baltica]MCS6253818.1 RHS repeat protein [Shewanella baltica]